MADMFAPLVAQLKANPKTIVFTEGNDPRILEAASKLLAEGVLKVVMVGNEAECKAAAAAGNFDISAAEIIDPENYAGFDEMVSTMVELRKGKQSAEECTALLKKSNYFGTMLVKMGKADCLLGGATYSTADTIRPALQLVKTKKGAHLVSSCFILDRDCGEEGLKRIAMGDCAVNIDYTDTVDKATGEVKISAASKLAEVAVETARTAKLFGIDPKVAVLSFSTKGSGKGLDLAGSLVHGIGQVLLEQIKCILLADTVGVQVGTGDLAAIADVPVGTRLIGRSTEALQFCQNFCSILSGCPVGSSICGDDSRGNQAHDQHQR